MKAIAFVALFTIVAVQLCHAAPMPEEEKKVEAQPSPAVAESSPVPQVRTEAKSESPNVESSVAPVEVTVQAEEKKP